MEKTVSVTVGKGSTNHNNRKFILGHVDQERTKDNITLVKQNIREKYKELFGAAQEKYNQKQTRSDRKIEDYFEKIRTSNNGEKLFHEAVVQIGDHIDTNAKGPDAKIATEILKEYAENFEKRNPNLKVFNSVIHLDEETPHLHIDYIPVATNQKRGIETKNSLSMALAQQGFQTKGKGELGVVAWLEAERNELAHIMKSRGIDRKDAKCKRKHIDLNIYKAQMEANNKELERVKANNEIKSPNTMQKLAGIKEDEVIVKKEYIDILSSQVEKQAQVIEENDYQNDQKTRYFKTVTEELDNREKSIIQREKAILDKEVGQILLSSELEKLKASEKFARTEWAKTNSDLHEKSAELEKLKDLYNQLYNAFDYIKERFAKTVMTIAAMHPYANTYYSSDLSEDQMNLIQGIRAKAIEDLNAVGDIENAKNIEDIAEVDIEIEGGIQGREI